MRSYGSDVPEYSSTFTLPFILQKCGALEKLNLGTISTWRLSNGFWAKVSVAFPNFIGYKWGDFFETIKGDVFLKEFEMTSSFQSILILFFVSIIYMSVALYLEQAITVAFSIS